jgi:uncharacterized membrane protein
MFIASEKHSSANHTAIAILCQLPCFLIRIFYNQGMQPVPTSPEGLKKRNILRWLIILVTLGLLVTWLWLTPPGVFGKADAIGYAVCHRIEARSFHIGNIQFPLCARCTGQYLGAMSGLAVQAIWGKRRSGSPPRRVIAILIILAIIYGVDGLNSYVHLPPLVKAFPEIPRLYEPNNTLRLLTGTGMGLVIAAALYPAFTSSVYRTPDSRPAIPGLKSLAGIAIIALMISGLTLTHLVWLLFFLALISVSGVLVLLVMVYTIVLLMIFRIENQFDRLSQVFFPMIAAFAITLIQIGVFDAVRFFLTRTWGEFQF